MKLFPILQLRPEAGASDNEYPAQFIAQEDRERERHVERQLPQFQQGGAKERVAHRHITAGRPPLSKLER